MVIAERFTYRYRRHGATYENHYDTQAQAERRATDDVERLWAIPVCIKADNHAILHQDDILDLWEERFLRD